jgi:diacylglycerol kinase (ATP)
MLPLIKKIGRANVIRNIGKLYNGCIIYHPKVETFRGRSIVVESDRMIHVEADGESLGHTLFHFEIIPSSICVIAGKEYEPAFLSA